jgi:hypothetical protein
VKPQPSLQSLFKSKYFPPDQAAAMLRLLIHSLRYIEPHGIEAHDAAIALFALVENLAAAPDPRDYFWKASIYEAECF